MTLLLDSTVLIDVLRGRPAAGRLRLLAATGTPLLTTAINVEEILRGLRSTEESAADALLAALRVLPLRGQDGVMAGRWRRDHAGRGMTLSQADCLIAACAVGFGARLATGNVADFPMDDLVVEHWPVGR